MGRYAAESMGLNTPCEEATLSFGTAELTDLKDMKSYRRGKFFNNEGHGSLHRGGGSKEAE
jgi:hypothetical protein